MTEAEWNGCKDPTAMLGFLRDIGSASPRKLRLFAVVCCRRTWHGLVDGRSRHVVEVAERWAEGRAADSELREAFDVALSLPYHSDAFVAVWTAFLQPDQAATSTAVFAASFAADGITRNPMVQVAERVAQVTLLRDILGPLPFRSLSLEEAWLQWNDSCVVKLATAIYEGQRFEEMPILADALEEAGCANLDILEHCRSAGEHVRGCWVLDLLLGKE